MDADYSRRGMKGLSIAIVEAKLEDVCRKGQLNEGSQEYVFRYAPL